MHYSIRVLLVAEHASSKFGGEAILPLHYFKQLNAKGIPTWLVVHERTRAELSQSIPQLIDKISFIPDTRLHIALWKLGQYLPKRVATFTTGLISRIYTQILQRKLIANIISINAIDIIHQPMPVSPKDPSLVFGYGIPVVIGPLNGGMNYPPNFNHLQGKFEHVFVYVGRLLSNIVNIIIPGKLLANSIIVANTRTREALPFFISRKKVTTFVENGVDLSLWKKNFSEQHRKTNEVPVFVFMGRLVDWKAVDILLEAFQLVSKQCPAKLLIIGDGEHRKILEQQAQLMRLLDQNGIESKVEFTGWMKQVDCAARLDEADILVLPSLLECGGAVVLEAMAMGKPVIATNWGGPADYLDEECGILVHPSSREALVRGFSEAMIKLALDPSLRSCMGESGRLKIEKQYNWSIKSEYMIQIYRNVLEQQIYQ